MVVHKYIQLHKYIYLTKYYGRSFIKMVLNQNTFQEVSSSAGIIWSRFQGNEAFSVNWVDLNNDGFVDLWVSPHGFNGASQAFPTPRPPVRYINNGDGTFTRDASDFRRGSGGDTHGVAFADFDNDGDQDALVAGGGQLGAGDGQPNIFFVNNAGNFQNEAVPRGLENTIARGRSALWFDANGDGLLDVVITSAARDDGQGQTAFFQQRADGTFFDASAQVGFDVANQSSRYAQLGDVNGDGNVDLIIQGTFEFPLRVYDFSSGGTFQDITSQFSNLQSTLTDTLGNDETQDLQDTTAPRDSIIADFNNDGFNDIFVVRSRSSVLNSSVFQGSSNIVSADLIVTAGAEVGFNFQTGGNIAVDVFSFFGTSASIDTSQIFIGASGRNPTQAELVSFIQSQSALVETSNVANTEQPNFTLSSSDSSVVGLAADRSQAGLYLGFNTTTQTWEFILSSPNNSQVQVAVQSTTGISGLTEVGFETPDDLSDINGLPDQLFVFNPATGSFEDRSVESGFGVNTLGQSAVSGDFDNDGDLDIYVANTGPSFNVSNTLYENQGDGTFVAVELAGGAAGETVGPHRLDFAFGQRIAVADFDNNGFLDIFTGSTTERSSAGTTYLGAPSQLFQNQGNGNNYILLDLEGTISNRDAIGARVTVITPDGNTQIREQNGGIHHFAQNDQRIHFGLGTNTSISSLVIEFPSGTTLEFNNFTDINQILNVSEDGTISGIGGVSDPSAGDDLVEGTDVGDNLSGGAGNDTLTGLLGPDTLNGEEGNDSLVGGGNLDLLDGGADDDVLEGDGGADSLFGGSGDDQLFGGEADDVLEGGDGNDTLEGDNGNDVLDGGAGTDIATETGNLDFTITDSQLTGRGTDELIGIEQVIVTGGGGSNTLDASAATIQVILSGAGGADIITGGAGDDVIAGGSGNDTLAGGAGSDTFLFSTLSDRNNNILDFTAEDVVAISASGFGAGLTAGTVSADIFTLGNSASDADDRFIFNPNNGRLLFDSDGTGANAQIVLATFSGDVTISNDDLEIIA